MKLSRRLVVRDCGIPWLRHMDFSYNPKLQAKLKQFPGFEWNSKRKMWTCAVDLLSIVKPIVEEAGLEWINKAPAPERVPVDGINETLHVYQTGSVEKAIAQRAIMLVFEMGLGKTPAAIEVMRLLGVKSYILIVPALVRINWVDELNKWWPDHPFTLIADTGKKAESWDGDGGISVSYALVGKVLPSKVDCVILDESQNVAKSTAARSKAAREILRANPDAMRLMLTATPITNRPLDIFNQIDLLRPGSMGNKWKFQNRYMRFEENEYATSGKVPVGLEETIADELSARLGYFTVRATKCEYGHLLPPCLVQAIRVRAQRGFRPRDLLERFTGMRSHKDNPDSLIRAAASQKIDYAINQAHDSYSGGQTVALLTHLKATADEVAASLASKYGNEKVCHVDGNVPVKKRIKTIKEAIQNGVPFLVTTMHAVNVGIDLTHWTTAVFVELSYTPGDMVQAVGRFSRLSGKEPSTILLLVLESTQDEIIAARLLEKVRDINKLVQSGQSEKGLEEAFSNGRTEEEDELESLRLAAQSYLEGDEYGS